MKYTWKATSNDGSYEDNGERWFDTHKEAYEDMRYNALVKMNWNTEWSDFFDMDKEDWIGYNVKFHPNYIIHESYSGIYTYKIVAREEKVNLHGNTWTIIDEFIPRDGEDWLVASFEGVGDLWMNNCDGYMVLITPENTILKSDI